MRKIKQAIAHIQKTSEKKLTAHQIFKQLELPKSKLKLFYKALNSMKKKEEKKKPSKRKNNQAAGVMHLSSRGFGFVELQDPKLDDVFIPKHQMHGAMDGDLVEILFFPGKRGKGPEGKVLSIQKRKRKEFIATITDIQGAKALALAPSITENQNIEVDLGKVKVNLSDRVLLEIKEFGNDISEMKCVAKKNLGSINDASRDIHVSIADFGLKNEFPKEAIEEAKRFGTKVTKEALKDRRDLTKKVTLTIDPTTAKDYDDAITIEKDSKGNFELGVHIADVAYYVKVGSALDKEAIKRSNSTYFPGEVLPMIPFELSNELCSLKPQVQRLTMSVMMRFDANGELLHHEIFRSYIFSDQRLTYEQALEILEGREKSLYKKQIDLMLELTTLLKKQRAQRGSVEFGLPEAIVLCDTKGVPQKIEVSQYDITHQMIEEFMLKANEVVATHLTKKQLQMIYRVHEEPSQEDYKEFVAMARVLGMKLPSHPSSSEIAETLHSIDDPFIAKTLAIHYIRSMKLAIYSEDNIGHFGLSLENYCHFTSPIRRYSDLVIQRLIAGEKPANIGLSELAKQISEQERISAKAESSVAKLKKLRLLQAYYSQDPNKEYDAIITQIKPNGIVFELKDLMMEGFLPLRALDDDYTYLKTEVALVNKKRKKVKLFSGLVVRLNKIDLISQASQFELVAIEK